LLKLIKLCLIVTHTNVNLPYLLLEPVQVIY